jgi:hypothetical protein
MNGLAAVLGVFAIVAGVPSTASVADGGVGSALKPVGATQPSPRVKLPDCDATATGLSGGQEGACRLNNVTVVAVDHAHAVALKLLTVDVVNVTPIGRIKIGSGSIGPLDPNANTWVAFRLQMKNTSHRPVTFRDEQLNLRLGANDYPTQPEATSSEPDSLTRPNRKIQNGKTITGSVVFEVPTSDLGMLTTAPASLRFTGFGGDFSFNQFPGGAVGVLRLYR